MFDVSYEMKHRFEMVPYRTLCKILSRLESEGLLVECYTKNDDAFQRLLGNDQFQKAVMDIMAKELYKTLVSGEEKK